MLSLLMPFHCNTFLPSSVRVATPSLTVTKPRPANFPIASSTISCGGANAPSVASETRCTICSAFAGPSSSKAAVPTTTRLRRPPQPWPPGPWPPGPCPPKPCPPNPGPPKPGPPNPGPPQPGPPQPGPPENPPPNMLVLLQLRRPADWPAATCISSSLILAPQIRVKELDI